MERREADLIHSRWCCGRNSRQRATAALAATFASSALCQATPRTSNITARVRTNDSRM